VATRSVQILGTGQLLELQRRLRSAGHENLRRSMQRRVRRAAEPLRADLQQTMRTLQLRSQASPGRRRPSPTSRPLRATIAAAIRISVRTTGQPGARVWVDRSALPPDLRNMPNVLNSGRVRHPVFGNRRKWATQWPTPSNWWDETVRRHQPRMRAEMARITDDIQRRLE
jgi:hypothetical protein